MATTDSIALVDRLVADVYNQRNLDAATDLLAPIVLVDGETTTLADVIAAIQCQQELLPGIQVEAEAVVAADDLVVASWTTRGGASLDVTGSVTGRSRSWSGLRAFRIVNGRIAEIWLNWLALEQLHARDALPAIPLPAGFAAAT